MLKPNKTIKKIGFFKKKLILWSTDRELRTWDLKRGKELHILTSAEDIFQNILIHENTLISSAYDSQSMVYNIKIWDLKNGKELYTLKFHETEPVRIKSFLPYRNKLILSLEGEIIKVLELKNGKESYTLRGNKDLGVPLISYTVTEDKLIAWTQEELKIFDLENGKNLYTFTSDQPYKTLSHFFVTGNKLVCILKDGHLKVYNLENGKELYTLIGNKSRLSYPPQMLLRTNKLILWGQQLESKIKIFDLKSGKKLHTLNRFGGSRVENVLTYGHTLIVSKNRKIHVYDLESGQELYALSKAHEISGLATSLMPEGQLTSGYSEEGKVNILDFNPLSSSLYSSEDLEENLQILEAMADPELIHYPEAVQTMSQKLHADFQQRLEQHTFKVGGKIGTPLGLEAIFRMLTEVCVEMLRCANDQKDEKRVSELIDQLIWIDPKNIKIYQLFYNICGRYDKLSSPKDSDDEIRAILEWGRNTFHNKRGYFAFREKAILAFKEHLKERWDYNI